MAFRGSLLYISSLLFAGANNLVGLHTVRASHVIAGIENKPMPSENRKRPNYQDILVPALANEDLGNYWGSAMHTVGHDKRYRPPLLFTVAGAPVSLRPKGT